jgi:hypothetical protein
VGPEYIPDDLYNSIARAADLLYAQYMQDLPVYTELNRLAQIDEQVDREGTAEATAMLNEIFKQSS